MPRVRTALVRTALREDAEKVVFGDREGRAPRPKPTRRRPQGLCLDRGYDYDEVRALAEEFGFTCHTPTRRSGRSCGGGGRAATGAGHVRPPRITARDHFTIDARSLSLAEG
jgi:hypothetical protein